MKRILVSVIALFCAFSLVDAQDGLVLSSLWQEYDAAARSDEPLRQLSVLERIKSEALKAGLPADYYRSGKLYRDVQCSRNWKLRDSLDKAFALEIENCGMSVAQFYYMKQRGDKNLLDFVLTHRNTLEAGSNSYFRHNGYYTFGLPSAIELAGFIRDRIENDYEYALWSLTCSDRDRQAADALSPLLDYPKIAILEFIIAEMDEEFAAFRGKYSGKAAGLMAEEIMLSSRFDSLAVRKASSEDFKAFRQECRDFENRRLSFTGEENKLAQCFTHIKSICEELDGKDLSGSIENGKLTMLLRNLDRVKVTISKAGEKGRMWSGTFENKTRSYYVTDTLECILPDFDDGEYNVTLSSGKFEAKTVWRKYSISLAYRWDADGPCIFAADYLSGEPVKKADIYCSGSEKELEPVKDFRFNGFTRLPSSMSEHITWSGLEMYCRYRDESGHLRQSPAIDYHNGSYSNDTYFAKPAKGVSGMILPDCCAFNPGQTLHFKTILFNGDSYNGFETLEGEAVSISLANPDGKVIYVHEGVTDSFGGASGMFKFPEDCKGGIYRIILRHKRNVVGSSRVRVDEFVLPSYQLQFESVEGLHFPGDTVQVKGMLKSYSGHPVSSVRMSYEASGAFEETGEIMPDKDGEFTINLKIADKITGYRNNEAVKVKIIDENGEVLEFCTSFNISRAIHLEANLSNAAEGRSSFHISGEKYISPELLPDEKAEFSLKLNSGTAIYDSVVEYRITGSGGREIKPWRKISSLSFEEDFSSFPCGLYFLEARSRATSGNGKLYKDYTRLALLKVPEKESPVSFPVEFFFKVLPGKSIGLQMGTGNGKVWACVELFGQDGKLLKSQLMTLNNQTKIIDWTFEPEYPESVTLHVFYFKNGQFHDYDKTFHRNESLSYELPFSIERFTDMALPSSEVRMSFKTEPGVQCTATVFDKSTENIMTNVWRKPVFHKSSFKLTIRYKEVTGFNSGFEESEDAIPFQMFGEVKDNSKIRANGGVEDISDIVVRENFETALCFEPSLISDADGNVELSFKTSDKLSTYIVQIYAHDRKMKSSVLRKEMLVTIPLKVSVHEPQFLYEGDRYVLKATVSSNFDTDIDGKLVLDGYGSCDCTVPAGGSVTKSFEIGATDASDSLDFLLAFKSEIYSDAIRFSIPVLPSRQVVTEAHSMIVHPGDDVDNIQAELLSRFANGSGYGAQYCEKSILQMVNEALPDMATPESDNVISLSSALYSTLLSSSLGKSQSTDNALIVKKILDCLCSDGGFGWYAGMKSSPIITAAVLERIAAMKERGILPEALEEISGKAAEYLDKEMFSPRKRPVCCGRLSMEQYMSVRSKFCDVPLTAAPDAAWKINARNYLVPKKDRGLNGAILSKARRLETLRNLSSDGGKELAEAWGIDSFTAGRIRKSIKADLNSLLEYAVPHKCGGTYYPNAVMPYRGLLESELYAHSFLCGLLDGFSSSDARCSQVADGIRLWIMIQKETQQWESDPAYVDAIASVLEGSDYVLDTKVAYMTKRFLTEFSDVKPAGNGMKLECGYYIDGKAVSEGDTLRVGDKIEARYRIWNEENRSFVRLEIPHPASFFAADQLSGLYGWQWKPIIANGAYSIVPQGYREVKADRTIFSFDSFPEESTTFTEYFHVTQTGVFRSAAPVVECLYSPHFRANGAAVCGMASGQSRASLQKKCRSK